MAPQYHYKSLDCEGDMNGFWSGLAISVACLPSDQELLVSGTTLQVRTAPIRRVSVGGCLSPQRVIDGKFRQKELVTGWGRSAS